MKVRLCHDITGRVLWEDEVDCPDDASEAVKRGLAVLAALKSGADLRGADLRGAYLRGADLDGVNWGDGAKWAEDVLVTREPLFTSTGIYDVWLLDRHAQVGCPGSPGFLRPLDEWAAMGEAEIARMDGARSIAFWRAWREPLLALAKAAGRPLPAAEIPVGKVA